MVGKNKNYGYFTDDYRAIEVVVKLWTLFRLQKLDILDIHLTNQLISVTYCIYLINLNSKSL